MSAQDAQADTNAQPSPTGSNLQALIDASLPISFVLSNRKNAYGLQRAASADIPTDVFSLLTYTKANPGKTRADYDALLASRVLDHSPDLVVLAGFMHILSEHFLDPFVRAGVRILNLHPALPGQFDGANAIQRAWDAFQAGEIANTGVMVHEVIKEVDRGQPLVVREIECRKGESVDDLAARIHAVEHEILVEATRNELRDLALVRKLEGATLAEIDPKAAREEPGEPEAGSHEAAESTDPSTTERPPSEPEIATGGEAVTRQ